MRPWRKTDRQAMERQLAEDLRPSVDWMDFDADDGGPTRNPVHLGVRPMEADRGDSDAGIEVGDTDETPDTVSRMGGPPMANDR